MHNALCYRWDRACTLCGRSIPRGHTCFVTYLGDELDNVLCWECGFSLTVYHFPPLMDEMKAIPPFGGGLDHLMI